MLELAKQLLSNFYLENINLQSNPNANPQIGVAYKRKTCNEIQSC